MVEVEISIPPELYKQLDPAAVDRALTASTRAVGEELRQELSKTPPPVHYPIIWASEKQRRFYFAMRRELGLPYVRESDPQSQRLLRSWTVTSQGTSATVATRGIAYAHYVQAEQYQSGAHQATGWTTDAQAVNTVQRSGDIERITEAAAKYELGL